MAEEDESGRPDVETCIENCSECQRLCLETVEYCLRLGGQHASQVQIRRLTDCAHLCVLAVDFIIRNSDLRAQACAFCAVACERCADQCEFLADHDLQFQECAEICAQCAESCRELMR